MKKRLLGRFRRMGEPARSGSKRREFMAASSSSELKLGINGLGRIGKLTLWHHVARKAFGELVVNLGRSAGKSLADVAHYIERDSTYGWLHGYLHGHQASSVITDVDEQKGTLRIDGLPVRFLREKRNPAEIGWWWIPPGSFWIQRSGRRIPRGRCAGI
jgi:hypothetical protein